MKGIVFNEFLEMVEAKFGYVVLDNVIEKSNLTTKGVYSNVGTYDHNELVTMVVTLSNETKIDIPVLLKTYGEYLFTIFEQNYSIFFENVNHIFNFFENIDKIIHVEVRKLYPDAELPKFESNIIDDKNMTLVYKSNKGLFDFAEGLMIGASKHFNVNLKIEKELLNQDGTQVKFNITILE